MNKGWLINGKMILNSLGIAEVEEAKAVLRLMLWCSVWDHNATEKQELGCTYPLSPWLRFSLPILHSKVPNETRSLRIAMFIQVCLVWEGFLGTFLLSVVHKATSTRSGQESWFSNHLYHYQPHLYYFHWLLTFTGSFQVRKTQYLSTYN